jgi:hypothetical protein
MLSYADHGELIDAMDKLEGMVLLCGYVNTLYDGRLGH